MRYGIRLTHQRYGNDTGFTGLNRARPFGPSLSISLGAALPGVLCFGCGQRGHFTKKDYHMDTTQAITQAAKVANWDTILKEIALAIAASSETQEEAYQRLDYMALRAQGYVDVAIKDKWPLPLSPKYGFRSNLTDAQLEASYTPEELADLAEGPRSL